MLTTLYNAMMSYFKSYKCRDQVDSLGHHHQGKLWNCPSLCMLTMLIFFSMPYQSMFGGPQQSYAQGSPGQAANPWAQYPYQQAYGAAAAAQVCENTFGVVCFGWCLAIVCSLLYKTHFLLFSFIASITQAATGC